MAKASWLKALGQRKDFLLQLGATMVAIIGIASAVMGITDTHFNVGNTVLLFVVAFASSFLVNARSLITPQVSVDDVVPFEIGDDFFVRVHCPCDLRLSAEAKRLASQCFATSYTIAPEIYEQLRVKNPYILACLTDNRGVFLGYFDVIPVKEGFAAPLIKGAITEASITHEDVLAPHEMSTCKYLFLSGLAVCNQDTHSGRRNANTMVWAILKYLESFYGTGHPFAFAIAATKAGDELLRRFRLNLEGTGTGRLDRSNIYSIVITRQEILWRLARMPDWSRLCELDWVRNVPILRGQRPRRPRLPKSKQWSRMPTAAVSVRTG